MDAAAIAATHATTTLPSTTRSYALLSPPEANTTYPRFYARETSAPANFASPPPVAAPLHDGWIRLPSGACRRSRQRGLESAGVWPSVGRSMPKMLVANDELCV